MSTYPGFLDFLSAIAAGLLTESLPAVLVLNSNAMRERAVEAIRQSGVRGVELYLDHDRSGRDLAGYFRQELADLDVADRSDRYAGYKDVNEYLVAHQEPTATAP